MSCSVMPIMANHRPRRRVGLELQDLNNTIQKEIRVFRLYVYVNT